MIVRKEEIYIDVNADLGEGMLHDEALMPFLSSCSIACGGHFGNDTSMYKAVQLAKKHDVKVGAHPSFPDTNNFGRKIMTMTKAELSESVYEQISAFFAVCDSEEIPVNHIKLHGALYNYAAKDAATADAVIAAILKTNRRPSLYAPPNSVLSEKAKNILPLVFEAFIDRRYELDLSLVARTQPNAIITDPEDAWRQLKLMVLNQEVVTRNGQVVPIQASTFCIHGDNPEAIAMLRFIQSKLTDHNIRLA